MITPAAQQLDISSDADLAGEARRVLTEEAYALRECSDLLDDAAFAKAIRLLIGTAGRVIVTGMGKSGAVARKFAGTLASTGTAAHFMHPAEALHGDLGVVAPGDIVCAFSYSGETDEVNAILPALHRVGTPIIAITSRAESTLGSSAAVVLNVEVRREACPMNLAPTTSTTVMLGISDAIALTLMQAKQFTSGDYALRHPGGSLGRRLLMRVRDVMRKGDDVAMVRDDATLLDAVAAIHRAHAGAAIIVDASGRLAGLLTHGDFSRAMVADAGSGARPVREIMNARPGTINPDMMAVEGLQQLEHFHPTPGELAGDAPVVDRNLVPVGMLTLKDLVRAGIAKAI